MAILVWIPGESVCVDGWIFPIPRVPREKSNTRQEPGSGVFVEAREIDTVLAQFSFASISPSFGLLVSSERCVSCVDVLA